MMPPKRTRLGGGGGLVPGGLGPVLAYATVPGAGKEPGITELIGSGWQYNSETGELTPPPVAPPPAAGALPTTGMGTSLGQISGPSLAAPTTMPTTAPTADPYAAFKAAFQKDYGRPITQEEMNSNQTLVKLGISNELFTKLPLNRQMAFPSDRLAALDNADFQRLVEHNPQVAGDFPTKFWQRFSNDWLAKVVGPFFQQNNPAEWTNIVNQNQIGGAAAGALPPELAPLPGTPPPSAAPPGGVAGPPPAVAPPYAGPGQFGIPRAQQPTLPSDIASRSALEQYYAMLGYGNVARPPATAVAGRLAGIGDIETGENLTLPEGFEPGTRGEPITEPTTIPPPGGFVDTEGKPIPDYPASPLDVRYRKRSDGSTETLTPTYENVQELIPIKDPETGAILSYEKGTTTRLVWKSLVKSPATGGAGRAPATPEEQAQAAANLQYTNAQIAALEARVKNDEAQLALAKQAQDFNQQIAIQDRLDKAKAELQNFTLQRDQLVQRQAEFGAELTQRQAEFGATATGMVGGQPTLQREVAIQQADLTNKRTLAENAVNAANIALRQGDQTEARRQFDIAQGLRGEIERGQLALGGRAQTESELQGAANRATQAGQLALAQGNAAEAKRQFDVAQQLTQQIQTGQLGLATRAQTESERAGEFGRGLQASQFQFQVQRDPASFVQKAYAARGVAPPAATTAGAPTTVQAGAPPEAARVSGALATTQAPLTAGEIKASVGPGLARTLEGQAPGEFFSEIPRLSGQKYNLLMPSERAEYGAAALASGTSPADLEEEIRRRSQTGSPPPAVVTRTKARPRARLF